MVEKLFWPTILCLVFDMDATRQLMRRMLTEADEPAAEQSVEADLRRKLEQAFSKEPTFRTQEGMGTGWLSPHGDFIKVRENHGETGKRIIDQLYPEADVDTGKDVPGRTGVGVYDFLLSKGWIRIDATGAEVQRWTRKIQKLLYDYVVQNPPTIANYYGDVGFYLDEVSTGRHASIDLEDYLSGSRVRLESMTEAKKKKKKKVKKKKKKKVSGVEYYHVTDVERVPAIQKEGLLPMQSSNWEVSGTGERYGEGQVFAFENKWDAIKWASRMDWGLHQASGSGNIFIVTFRPEGQWEVDDADPLSQLGAHGRWLKGYNAIPVENIISIEPVTSEDIKAFVAVGPKINEAQLTERDQEGMGTGWLSPEFDWHELSGDMLHWQMAELIIGERFPEEFERELDPHALGYYSALHNFLFAKGYIRIGTYWAEVGRWNPRVKKLLHDYVIINNPVRQTIIIDTDDAIARIAYKDFIEDPDSIRFNRKQVKKPEVYEAQAQDMLSIHDLYDYDIGKSILVGNTWYTVRRQNKDLQRFLVDVADFENDPGSNPHWLPFKTIVSMVNRGVWGFQHKDERRGRKGWFGKESPRHEGRHDFS
jgi:hypothetical protein